MMTNGKLSPHRDHAISTNPGRGVRGWLLDSTSHGTISWVGVACKVIWVVVVVCSTGHLSPWAADRDPQCRPSSFCYGLQSHSAGLASQGRAGSASWGKLISTQLEGKVSLRTYSSVKETSGFITCQHSNTLFTKSRAHQGLAVGPFPSSAEEPSHRQGSSAAAQAGSLNCQTVDLEAA